MNFRQIFLACAIVASAAVPAAHAATVFGDNFDKDPLKLDTAPAGWTVTTEGKVNLIGNNPDPASEPGLPDPLPGNGVYVDLIGTSGAYATLVSPTFALDAGTEYIATFALAGSQFTATEYVQVNFGDTETVYTLAAADPFKTFSLSFTPTSSADYSITFQTVDIATPGIVQPMVGPGGADRGALLDALVVSSVPEPATYALMLLGLAGLHLIARRRLPR